ncbi:MAG: tetratricopeptide repeat protein [Anaerolineae bacterium]
MLATLRIQLLGGLRLALDDKPLAGLYSNKAPALVAYLAVTRRAPTRDLLAALLWGEMNDADARTNLRQCLTNLRKLLGPYLIIARDAVAFNFDAPYTLDTQEFEQLLQTENRPAALALYTGDFLDGVFVREAPGFEEWALAQRARLREQALQAMGDLVAWYASRGDLARGIEHAMRLVALDPWREEIHRELMLMLARSGQRSRALQQYETCRRILVEQMGVEPSAETTTLYERLRAAGASTKHNLEPQPTTFVGRAPELAQIEADLRRPDCRLITLLGAGGVGKTRLAIQAAERALKLGAFLNGVYFVSLEEVNSPDLVAPAMSSACNLAFEGKQDASQQLVDFLREKEILYVLDGLEHLLAATPWLGQLLRRAPHLKLLVTSRERLNIQWEWLIAIRGLDYPHDASAPADSKGPDASGGQPAPAFAAVELFVERARQARHDFELSNINRAGITRVCQLVEGLPLGIELAAAWVHTQSIGEIAREIERGYGFLATAQRDVPDRQRSLRAVFEHSWQLLNPAVQGVFGRLSVFRGGFTAATAERIAGASLADLTALVDKSLLRRNAAGRYEFHEQVRHFAQDKLRDVAGMEALTRDRHGAYYAAFLAQRTVQVLGAGQQAALSEIGGEIDNVHAAWQWMVAQRRADWIESSFASLAYFYEVKGWFQEGVASFQRAAAALAGAREPALQTLYARLLIPQINFLIRLDHYEQAREIGYTCLQILRNTEARMDYARAVSAMGHIVYRLGNLEEAKRLMRESVDLLRAEHDPRTLSVALNNLGVMVLARGEYAYARELFQEGLTLKRQLGDQRSIANSLDNLGIIAREQQDLGQAWKYHQESLAIYQGLGDQRGAQTARNNLGAVAFRQGNYAEAKRLLETGDAPGRAGQPRGIVAGYTLVRLGAVCGALGEFSTAEQHLREALKMGTEIGSAPLLLIALVEIGAVRCAQRQWTNAVELFALVAYHASSEQESRDRARGLLNQLALQLDENVFAAAQERGQLSKLDAVVQDILREKGPGE